MHSEAPFQRRTPVLVGWGRGEGGSRVRTPDVPSPLGSSRAADRSRPGETSGPRPSDSGPCLPDPVRGSGPVPLSGGADVETLFILHRPVPSVKAKCPFCVVTRFGPTGPPAEGPHKKTNN